MKWLALLQNKWTLRAGALLVAITAFMLYRSSLIKQGREEMKAEVSKQAMKQIDRANEQTESWKVQANAVDAKYQEAMDTIRGFGGRIAGIERGMLKRTPSAERLAAAPKETISRYAAETDRDFAECRVRYEAVGFTAAGASAAAYALSDAWPSYEQTLEAQVRAITSKGK